MPTGGSITVVKDLTGDYAVNITRTDAGSLTVYSDAAYQNAVTFPDVITASKSYYLNVDNNFTISVLYNGLEIANTPNATRVGTVSEGKALRFSPQVDRGNLVGGAGAPWSPYTPVLGGSGWAVGNGTITGKFIKNGTKVDFVSVLTLGSTSTAGTVSPTITVPKTTAAAAVLNGAVKLYDVSATTYYTGQAYLSSTSVATVSSIGTVGVFVTTDSTHPFTWATGDIIMLSGSYEAAA